MFVTLTRAGAVTVPRATTALRMISFLGGGGRGSLSRWSSRWSSSSSFEQFRSLMSSSSSNCMRFAANSRTPRSWSASPLAKLRSLLIAPTVTPIRFVSTTTISGPTEDVKTHRIVGHHHVVAAALVFFIVALGGLTRLTESGLSITEWNVIKGMRWPSSPEEWEREFGLYKVSPEGVLLNQNITMEQFKFIFFMEWAHRNVGRFIGVFYVLPTLYFASSRRNMMTTAIRNRSLVICGLIGVQGLLGWLMVKSGLKEELKDKAKTNESFHGVSQYWLAAHLGTAFVIYLAMIDSALKIFKENPRAGRIVEAIAHHPRLPRLRQLTLATLALTFATAISGAFVAGLDAGLIYNEFPNMGDGLVPSDMWALSHDTVTGQSKKNGVSPWRNLLENPAAVQFDHRWLAMTTATSVGGVYLYSRSVPLPRSPRLAFTALIAAVTAQVTLGITTLLYLVPIPLASAHQCGSLVLMTTALWAVHSLRGSGVRRIVK